MSPGMWIVLRGLILEEMVEVGHIKLLKKEILITRNQGTVGYLNKFVRLV